MRTGRASRAEVEELRARVAQLTDALETMREGTVDGVLAGIERTEGQRMAREINDTIVQGLVAAEMALDLELLDQAREFIVRTLAMTRDWVGELGEDGLLPGTAVSSTTSDAR